MFNSYDIIRLYDNVLKNEVTEYCVTEGDIRYAIRNMKEVYMPNKTNWTQEVSCVAYYDDVAHRCAYLYKYAPLHTALVQEMFGRALIESKEVYKNILFSRMDDLKICSLGGGPGTDVIGVLAAVHELFGFQSCSAQIVELMSGWELTCNALLDELEFGGYGSLSQNISSEYLNCSYVVANLLDEMDSTVSDEIASADLITMVKFVSAATCKNTATMVENIFNLMKPGALILFIDNAAGGFGELLSRLAIRCNLESVFGPLNRVHYANQIFSIRRYGYTSCFETTVTIQILMKQYESVQTPRVRYDENLILRLQNHSSSASIQQMSTSSNYSSDFISHIPSSSLESPVTVSQLESYQYSQISNNYSYTGSQTQEDKLIAKQPRTTDHKPYISQNHKTKIVGYKPFNNVRNINRYFSKNPESESNQTCGENNFANDSLSTDSDELASIKPLNNVRNINRYFSKNPESESNQTCGENNYANRSLSTDSDELVSIKDGFMNVLENITSRIKCTFRTIIPIFNGSNIKQEGS